jgi:hypothetical protein
MTKRLQHHGVRVNWGGKLITGRVVTFDDIPRSEQEMAWAQLRRMGSSDPQDILILSDATLAPPNTNMLENRMAFAFVPRSAVSKIEPEGEPVESFHGFAA